MKTIHYKLSSLKKALTGLFFLMCLSTTGFAQFLASWNPSGVSNYGPSPWAPATTTTGITAGGLTRGAGVGLGGTAAANAWGGVNWAGGPTQDVTFTVTANPGCTISYSTFNFTYRRSGTGPAQGTLEYTFGNSTTYTVISSLSFASTATGGVPITPVNLSTIANLQNVPNGTVVKFRIFPTGGGPQGTWYTNGNGMSIAGTVSQFYTTIAQTSSIQCNGQTTGALTASVVGSTGPYTYSWVPAGGTSSVATGLAAGVYTCQVTSATNDFTWATYTVTQPAALSSSISSQTNVTCNGGTNGSVSVTPSGGTPAYTYTWAATTATGSTAGNLAAGNYTLSISDANACTTTQTVSITQPSIAISASASSSVICNGGTVTLNGVGATTYTWSNGVANGSPFTPTATAVYSVTGTNTLTGCANSITLAVAVNVNPTITAQPSATNAAVCNGASLTLTGSGASTYTWTGNVMNGTVFSPTSTSTYTVYGTDANGCNGSGTVTVFVNANPTITASSSKSMICKFESVNLTAGGGNSYSWSNGSTTTVTAVSPTVTTSYTVTGWNENGCSNKATVTQLVAACAGIETYSGQNLSLSIYPNPNNGNFTIKTEADVNLLIINELGQQMGTVELSGMNNHEMQLSNLPSGIYFITGTHGGAAVKQKIIVTR